jgi:hypothetical protein
LQQAKPFIYGPSGNDAKLTLYETEAASRHSAGLRAAESKTMRVK